MFNEEENIKDDIDATVEVESSDSVEDSTVEVEDAPIVNMPFIIGKKLGMVRIFDENGTDFPTTVVSAGPCIVTQIKTKENDGYSAYQLGFVDNNVSMVKPLKGHIGKAAKAKDINVSHFKEIRMDNSDEITLGSEIDSKIFEVGDLVTVKGTSKGRGFAGHMKRHNFSGGRKSHGKNSVMRKAGSVGAGTDPGKVWKGTRMAGQMGNDCVTVKNLEVIRLDLDNNLVFIKGAIPGANNGLVYLMK